MLSISNARTAGSATAYYSHMEKDSAGVPGEYYAKEAAGQWAGAGAARMGLEGQVNMADFKALCNGFDKDGVGLAQNAGDPDRRAGWDCTFSAPKSVSVAWSVADRDVREAIEKAHQTAVSEAVNYLEREAGYVRTGHNGESLEKADLVIATFQHGTSRAQEAQLHTHAFVMNAGVKADGGTNSLESRGMFDLKMNTGAVYQVALANELQKQGWSIERNGEDSFRIATVPSSLEIEHSTRRAEIVEAMEARGESSARAAAVAALDTRSAKSDIDLAALRHEWAQTAERHGYGPEQARPDYQPENLDKPYELTYNDPSNERFNEFDELQKPDLDAAPGFNGIEALDEVRGLPGLSLDDNQERAEVLLQDHARHDLDHKQQNGIDGLRWSVPGERQEQQSSHGVDKQPTADQVLRHATEHEAVIFHKDIELAALRLSIGRQDVSQALALSRQAESQAVRLTPKEEQGAHRLGTHYSTSELVKAERAVIAIVKDRLQDDKTTGQAAIDAALARVEEIKGFSLNAEQTKALQEICGEAGGVKVLIGDAGAGKSTTMTAVRVAHENAGYTVIGTATQGKAALELEQSAGIDSRSLAMLSWELRSGKVTLDQNTVVVIDEAGMVDSRAMAFVMRQAEQADSKVVLVGDYKQLQPVGAGATFKAAAEAAAASRLEDNQRQQETWEREAVKLVATGKAVEAMQKYLEHDRVIIEPTFKGIVEEIAKHQIANIDAVGHEKTLAIAATNVAVKAINEEIREQLKSRGELQDAVRVETSKGSIELAQDDRVLLRNPDKTAGTVNGDLGSVVKVDGNQITLMLDRTKGTVEIDAKRNDVTHGYAMTTHRVQGATVDRSTVYLSQNSFREMAYVQATRATQSTTYAVSTEALKQMKQEAKPSPEMIKAAQGVMEARLAAGKTPGLKEAALGNYAKTLAYLEKNRAHAPEWARVSTMKEQLKDTLQRMSQSKQKASTLDYKAQRAARTENKQSNKEKNDMRMDKVKTAADAIRDYGASVMAEKIGPGFDPLGRSAEALKHEREQAQQTAIERTADLTKAEQTALDRELSIEAQRDLAGIAKSVELERCAEAVRDWSELKEAAERAEHECDYGNPDEVNAAEAARYDEDIAKKEVAQELQRMEKEDRQEVIDRAGISPDDARDLISTGKDIEHGKEQDHAKFEEYNAAALGDDLEKMAHDTEEAKLAAQEAVEKYEHAMDLAEQGREMGAEPDQIAEFEAAVAVAREEAAQALNELPSWSVEEITQTLDESTRESLEQEMSAGQELDNGQGMDHGAADGHEDDKDRGGDDYGME